MQLICNLKKIMFRVDVDGWMSVNTFGFINK